MISLEVTPHELNFLQVAVDDLIDVQRSVIIDCAHSRSPDIVESATDSINRLRVGLNLKATLEDA